MLENQVYAYLRSHISEVIILLFQTISPEYFFTVTMLLNLKAYIDCMICLPNTGIRNTVITKPHLLSRCILGAEILAHSRKVFIYDPFHH